MIKNKRIKILVVEDELSYRELFEEILSADYEVICTKGLEEAKQKAKDIKPDIALVDMRLRNEEGNADGLDLVEYINSLGYKTVIILESGFPIQTPDIKQRIGMLNIFKVLDKSAENPVAELIHAVNEAVSSVS